MNKKALIQLLAFILLLYKYEWTHCIHNSREVFILEVSANHVTKNGHQASLKKIYDNK